MHLLCICICLCICLLKSTNHASKWHSRDKCRIQGIKTIFICICLCICILPLYLHSEIEKITLQSGIQDINTAFRASKTFSYAFAFAFAFCLCICILKSTNHASKRHSRDKCRIQGIKTIFLCICLCICIFPLYLHSEIKKSRFTAAFKR